MADPQINKCPKCSSNMNAGIMNKASLTNSLNWLECSNDKCGFETDMKSSLDNKD